VRQWKRKSSPAQPPLKAKWRTNIDDHPIGLAWSPDGNILAVAGVSGPITLFNGADGAVQQKLPGHAVDTMAISWHKNSRLLASVGQDGMVRLWDAETGTQQSEMQGGASWVERVAFSPTGDWLVSAAGRKLRLWNSNGELIREYPDANSTITDIKWRYDGKQFAISAYNDEHGQRSRRRLAAEALILALLFETLMPNLMARPDKRDCAEFSILARA